MWPQATNNKKPGITAGFFVMTYLDAGHSERVIYNCTLTHSIEFLVLGLITS